MSLSLMNIHVLTLYRRIVALHCNGLGDGGGIQWVKVTITQKNTFFKHPMMIVLYEHTLFIHLITATYFPLINYILYILSVHSVLFNSVLFYSIPFNLVSCNFHCCGYRQASSCLFFSQCSILFHYVSFAVNAISIANVRRQQKPSQMAINH